jgi:hypothetical protein
MSTFFGVNLQHFTYGPFTCQILESNVAARCVLTLYLITGSMWGRPHNTFLALIIYKSGLVHSNVTNTATSIKRSSLARKREYIYTKLIL